MVIPSLLIPRNRRESAGRPTRTPRVVDKPLQLTLAEQRVDKVETAKVPNVDLAQVERVEHPVVLRVAVTVFVGTQCMVTPSIESTMGQAKS